MFVTDSETLTSSPLYGAAAPHHREGGGPPHHITQRMGSTNALAPRVLVTGCSSGAGRGLAIEFHERGCKVLATARKVETLQELKAMGMEVAAVDVNVPETIRAALANFGDVDVACANAGCSFFGPLAEQPLERVKTVIDTNVIGVVATVQAVAPAMIARRRGVLVVVGSVSGEMVTPFAGTYCASKGAVNCICRALQMELDPFGVSVMNVITGGIQSSFSSNADTGSSLPEGSAYKPVEEALKARTWTSQTSNSVTPCAYARVVAEAALSASPPFELLAGGKAPLFHALGQYLPWAVARRVMIRTYGIHGLGRGRATHPGLFTNIHDKAWLTLAALSSAIPTIPGGPKMAAGIMVCGAVVWKCMRVQ